MKNKYNITKEFLEKEYLKNKKSTIKIAKEIGCSSNTIRRRLIKYKISRRSIGEFKFWIGNYNPDFINCNGQKKIIEVFGDYWHNTSNAKIRDRLSLKAYKKYGYKALIVWEHELQDLKKVKDKILNFNGGLK